MLDGPRSLIAVGASAASWQGDGATEPLHAYSGLSDIAVLKLYQKSTSATTVVSSNNPARVGSPVTFTASISSGDPGTPTGSVTFRDGATDLGTASLDTSGQATLTTSALALGSHTLSAEYSGDSLFLGSAGQLTQQITAKQATTTSLSSSRNPAIWGSSVTFTATVGSGEPGIPTGSVIFRDGTSDLGIAVLDISGKAALATSSLAQGSHSLSAEYGGDDLFSGSTGLLTQVIDLAKLYLPLILTGL